MTLYGFHQLSVHFPFGYLLLYHASFFPSREITLVSVISVREGSSSGI